jgi:phosphotransferase system enzyme I (PtsI)
VVFHAPPVSKGVAIGRAFVFIPFTPRITVSYIEPDAVVSGADRYLAVAARADEELTQLVQYLTGQGEPEKAAIFEAHIEILHDTELADEILGLIKAEYYAPEYAVETVYEKFIGILSDADDEVLHERGMDFKDIKNRILRILMGVEHKTLSEINGPAVVFAHDLLPSNTAVMDREKVLAIVTEIGGPTCHSAIIARSYGIPALLGIANVMEAVNDNDMVIVDAVDGELIIGPSEKELEQFGIKQKAYRDRLAEIEKYRSVPPLTKDGVRIDVCLNIGSTNDDELEAAVFADGVGLFRSEFLFMTGKEQPCEERQFKAYKKAAETFGERQVILRTLDIGGDKTLNYMALPVEQNPFLGCRALRLCFKNPDLFKTQLRAILRASIYGNLAIMFPMVENFEDLRRAKAVLQECREELKVEGIPFNEAIKVGIMIEIPAVALIADLIVSEVDFASIGTNDLCQYLLAVDRQNPDLADYYQSFHPGLLRLIDYTAKSFKKAGKPLSVCGELGGDPLAALVFIGMGIRKLSMSASCIAAVKRIITNLDTAGAKEAAVKALALSTAAEVEASLKDHVRTKIRR